jgi:SAM-dependent methyltransferase
MTDPKPFVFADTGEAKRYAPATERNRDAIADVLRGVLPEQGTILEIASGTGEHLVHFAARFPHLTWQPSDHDSAGLASISAWSAEAALPNICPPMQIDASAADWPIAMADAVLCINMVHIAPWSATEGLLLGASRLLPPGGLLYLYGPYREDGVPTAASNEDFDVSLKSRNTEWGLRSVEDVVSQAQHHGLKLEARIEMPANNLSLIFRR